MKYLRCSQQRQRQQTFHSLFSSGGDMQQFCVSTLNARWFYFVRKETTKRNKYKEAKSKNKTKTRLAVFQFALFARIVSCLSVCEITRTFTVHLSLRHVSESPSHANVDALCSCFVWESVCLQVLNKINAKIDTKRKIAPTKFIMFSFLLWPNHKIRNIFSNFSIKDINSGKALNEVF